MELLKLIGVLIVVVGFTLRWDTIATVGVGIPFLINQGANPAVVGALGLTAGYCGTLLTPMAASFNIMPAALLETKGKYSIIKAQAPIAVIMMIVHILLMYFWAF